MSPEKEDALYRKYPALFVQKDLPMTQTLMCWGCDCGDGWYDILDEMCSTMNRLIETGICKKIEFVQIKEKFATLRVYENHDYKEPAIRKFLFWFNRVFYKFIPRRINYFLSRVAWNMDPVNKAIYIAERKSAKTCEECGAPGKRNTEGYWLSTRCDSCREKDR